MTDPDSRTTMQDYQADIVAALDLDEFSADAYTSAPYLEAALEAGFTVVDLATAHDVSKRSIYRVLDRHDIDYETPPKNGPARRLWNAHPDTVPGDD
ncbi:hypothetical protein Har1131_18460 [Haloarcula sp. CBA1131]|uniref:hypothetical protein n=1 Tax=Haloarcula sp. CBA1131 TaxID=1853686 RepID=UPI001245F8CE|nr:hypothetical protein [Haloarcula sp. CBA1131]KAA9400556.1 hypothetical protein Har1131_17800 [Haloarcula sp. CBA1131]KAA9400670.1 hypothetical protein Har1131_18460 [Haloarcula sp. CBA1131]